MAGGARSQASCLENDEPVVSAVYIRQDVPKHVTVTANMPVAALLMANTSPLIGTPGQQHSFVNEPGAEPRLCGLDEAAGDFAAQARHTRVAAQQTVTQAEQSAAKAARMSAQLLHNPVK